MNLEEYLEWCDVQEEEDREVVTRNSFLENIEDPEDHDESE